MVHKDIWQYNSTHTTVYELLWCTVKNRWKQTLIIMKRIKMLCLWERSEGFSLSLYWHTRSVIKIIRRWKKCSGFPVKREHRHQTPLKHNATQHTHTEQLLWSLSAMHNTLIPYIYIYCVCVIRYILILLLIFICI